MTGSDDSRMHILNGVYAMLTGEMHKAQAEAERTALRRELDRVTREIDALHRQVNTTITGDDCDPENDDLCEEDRLVGDYGTIAIHRKKRSQTVGGPRRQRSMTNDQIMASLPKASDEEMFYKHMEEALQTGPPHTPGFSWRGDRLTVYPPGEEIVAIPDEDRRRQIEADEHMAAQAALEKRVRQNMGASNAHIYRYDSTTVARLVSSAGWMVALAMYFYTDDDRWQLIGLGLLAAFAVLSFIYYRGRFANEAHGY